MIQIAIDKGVPVIDAYNMATINVARYYNIEYLHGNIATGRIANINFLTDEENPTPVSVLAKGKWVKKDRQKRYRTLRILPWNEFDLEPIEIEWEIVFPRMIYSFQCHLESKWKMRSSQSHIRFPLMYQSMN